ncbi:MAG: Succinate dehydrogenase flavoprotein subunit, partial [uncultured Thermomicrobiales bacterium]
RLRPRRQPPRHQLAGRPGRLRSPSRAPHAPIRPRERPATAADRPRVHRPCRSRPFEVANQGRARGRYPDGDAGDHDGQRFGRPQRRRLDRSPGHHQRPPPPVRPRRDPGPRRRVQHRLARSPRTRLHAGLRRGDRLWRPSPGGKPRRPLPRRLRETRRRELARPHPGLQILRRPPTEEETGHDHGVRTKRAQVL